ncbi:MAG: hypothetical protein HYV09_13150 [Deltaproteobacteria bacterium]|nr:hypothetical protein [Deltaproteobacteria bacterium]
MSRSKTLLGLAVLPLLIAAACGTAQKKHLIEAGAEASDTQRRSAFEATARMLDEHPEYVDEFYAIARNHPRTFDRFLEGATKDLHDEELAKKQAAMLAEHPASLEQVMVQTLRAAADKKEARLAIARALEKTAPIAADIQADRKATTVAVTSAAIAVAAKRPSAAEGFHLAMRGSAPKVAAVMSKDPETLGVLTEELLKIQVKDKPALRKLLEKVGAID